MRLRKRVRVKTAAGIRELGDLKPATVHLELRVLRRVLNVAVRKKLLPANPCAGGISDEGQRAVSAPLRLVVRTAADRAQCSGIPAACNPDHYGDRLAPLQGADSDEEGPGGPGGRGRLGSGLEDAERRGGGPLTDIAVAAFRDQVRIAGAGPWLFPSDANPTGHQTTFKTVWAATLRRAKIPYFRIYDLRSTYAAQLSAGGVADEWVTQLLRQGDAKVFKKYSQMKLQIKREALQKMNCQAKEQGVLTQWGRSEQGSDTSSIQSGRFDRS